MNYSEQITATDEQAAEHIAILAMDFGGASPEAVTIAVNDAWLESTGNLHRFATRLREGDPIADGLLMAAIEEL